MLDEFDDMSEAASRFHGPPDAGADPVPRLITRVYSAADRPLRARLLAHLLEPLGPLGLAAIAAGAFAGFLQRRGAEGFNVSIEDVSRFSSDQIAELVRFVWQVSPQSLQALAVTLANNPIGATAFSASVLLLLTRTLEASAARKANR
jgi:hypothetical protein